jgi:hypothetical protein
VTTSLGGARRVLIAALLGATQSLVGCIETASLGAGPEGAGGEVGTGDAPLSTGGTSAGSVGGGLVGAGGGAAEGAVAGGGSSGGDIYVSGGSAGMEPACDVEEVLLRSCGRAGCHTASATKAAGLDLQTPGATARLIDVPATYEDITCPDPNGSGLPVTCIPTDCLPGRKLIDLANPDQSFLLMKLSGTQGACGSQMPLAPGMLTASELTCLQDWLYPHPPVVR